MFVPKVAGSQSHPKRRHRVSDESVKPPKAKRQRSALRQENAELHPDAAGEAQRESALDESSQITTDKAGIGKQIAIRGPKKAEQRDGGFDGAGVLVRCPCLPSSSRR